MKLNLDKDQVKNLINHAKEEVLAADMAKMAMAEAMNNMWNNDMNLHRVMMSTLAGAGQITMCQSLGVIPMNKKVSIEAAFKCEDGFTKEIFKILSKQAMYFGCFVRGSDNYADLVLEEATEVLKTETETVQYNQMDIRFANIAILMELMNKEKFEYTDDNFTIVSEVARNGSTPYIRTHVQYRSKEFKGNSYNISKGVYSYDYTYNYLELNIQNSQSFSNANGVHLMELPVGIIYHLDVCIRKLFGEYSGGVSVDTVLNSKHDELAASLNELVTVCLLKFNDSEGEEILTPEERMQSIWHYVRDKFQWSRTLTMNGVKVAGLQSGDIDLSEDKTVISLIPELNTFRKVSNEYENVKLSITIPHIGESNFGYVTKDGDDLTKLYSFWALNSFNKDLQNVVYSARELRSLKKFGHEY